MTRSKLLFFSLFFFLYACQANTSPTNETAVATPSSDPTATTIVHTATPVPLPTATAIPEPTASTVVFKDDVAASLTLFSETAVVTHQDRYINAGAIIFHDGLYHMFNNEFPAWPSRTKSYYYTSPDGEAWTLMSEEPVFDSRQVEFTQTAALILTGYVADDDTWVVYFHTFDSNSSQGFIGRATASDPLGPWMVDPEPVLSPGSDGEWDDLHVMRPNVLKMDEAYVMIYAGTADAASSQIGYATSPDGLTWTKYDDATTTEPPYAESDPILQPQAEWEGSWVGRPEVVLTEKGWVMLYEGGGNSNTGIAISNNGIDWIPYEDNPIFTKENSVNNDTFFQGELHYYDSLFRYYLEVGPGSRDTDIYLWTFDSPIVQ